MQQLEDETSEYFADQLLISEAPISIMDRLYRHNQQ